MNQSQWPESRSELYELAPDEFEEMVAAVWDARGFDTEVTQLSNDGGKDAIAKKNGRRIAIQAKRYQQSNRVTGPEIQQYGSLLHDEAIDDVVIVTSSTFTTSAYRRAQEIGLDLVDGERLLTLADKYRDSGSITSSDSSSESSGKSGGSVSLLALPVKLLVGYFYVMYKFIVLYFKFIIGLLLLPLKLLQKLSND